MKVTMLSVMCGPDGNAFPGTVLDVKGTQAVADQESGKVSEVPMGEYLITNKFARPFDAEKDRKAKQHGLVRAEK